MSSVLLYKTGECKSEEFIEDNFFYIGKDGTVHYAEFIEGSDSIGLDKNAFYAKEFLEKMLAYLTDESDILIVDEFGNNLTSII